MRPLFIIEAELKAASAGAERLRRAVSTLTAERAEVRRAREALVIEDFHAGLKQPQIAEKRGLPKNTVASILHRKGLHYRKVKTPISHLPADQQRAYEKAKRCGMGPDAARAFAVTVST